MRELKTTQKLYGLEVIKNSNEIKYYDKFLKSVIPFGNLLFIIVEAIDLFIQISKCPDNKETLMIQYFSDKEYDISELINTTVIDDNEINRLQIIAEYISRCNASNDLCSLESLNCLAEKIHSKNENLISIFHNTNAYRKINIPCNSEEIKLYESNNADIINQLDKLYSEFDFYTETLFNSLSELCILILYEMFSLNMIIKTCDQCKHLFAYPKNKNKILDRRKYCERPLQENDYLGCQIFKKNLRSKQYSENKLNQLHRRVYCRLRRRAKTKKIEYENVFLNFKTEWQDLTIKTKNLDEEEKNKKIKEFLEDERWK